MRGPSLALPLLLAAAPLAAQLNPQQRAAAERKAENNMPGASTRLMREWEERALNGDPGAYGGPVAREERRRLNEATRGGRILFIGSGEIPPGQLHGLWMEIGMRHGTPRTLRQVEGQLYQARAGIPLRLTLASPIGAPARRLMIKASIGEDPEAPTWTSQAEVVAGADGTYRIDVPTLRPGVYDLTVAVFDPTKPDAPYTSNITPLVVRTP